MSLSIGVRLGPYEVTALLGVGGMGEVYRALDTNLGRQVAIKVLPEAFAQDVDRLARFEREAKTLAALNHPNIAAIHGLEKANGIRALVMELVEGPTLADRIAHGPIAVDDALPIAKQIAEALEAAHEQGIVHRDLKPANIKLRPDGTVKVLDFGLAKALEPTSARSIDATASPTITSPVLMTGVGVLLGTAAYMSPEQARGNTVDKRADIWAFGCVVYEMLTGRRAFGREEIYETLAEVIRGEPDWNALPADTHLALRRVLRRCLAKDPHERLRDIGDARVEIDEALHAPDAGHTVRQRTAARRGVRLAWSVAAVSVALALLLAFPYLRRAPVTTESVRFLMGPPDGWNIAVASGAQGVAQVPLTVAPDGRRLAFVGVGRDGTTQIWVRSLDTVDAQPLAGTDGASSPFWSPDSRFLGFFADGKLKKVDLTGGPPITLCDAPDAQGGSWNQDGIILFALVGGGPLLRVSAAGGEPAAVTTLRDGEIRHNRPYFLPDGRHFFHYAVGPRSGIHLAAIDSPERVPLPLNADAMPVIYSQGHLLFMREGTLMAQPFDLTDLELSGEAFPIAEQIQLTGGGGPFSGVFSASPNGVLAYRTGSGPLGSELRWFDRSGKPLGVLGERSAYSDIRLSPSGRHAVVSLPDETRRSRDIWIYDVVRGFRTRFTFDPANDYAPVWSPDGTRVVFASERKSPEADLYIKASDGSGLEEVLLEDELDTIPQSWSPDGASLLYSDIQPGGLDLYLLPLSGDRKPAPFLRTPFNDRRASFSPDGRWIAYASNESGMEQIYVAAYPGLVGKRQVSTAGGTSPRWRADGREIFFVAPGNGGRNALLAAEVDGRNGTFEVTRVTTLFEVILGPGASPYDVHADGRRFLVSTLPEETSALPITVVFNWTAGLAR